MTRVSELQSCPVLPHNGNELSIRIFELSLNDVTVELSSLGASITKVLLPNYSRSSTESGSSPRDDVVLSYATARDQYEDKNRHFFGAIVGRVANRIKGGQFQLLQTKPSSDEDVEILETYQLDNNNGPNHLHGGFDGFSNRIWTANIVENGVQFMMISPDGDQGYPGGIEVTATYSLVPIQTCNGVINGAKLSLAMKANLLPGETKATPIALAQHSYFNLASHASEERILNHILHMPHCNKFTPVDNTSIPTREVQRVEDSMTPRRDDFTGVAKAMDFRTGKVMADALVQYGHESVGLEHHVAVQNVHRILTSSINNAFDESKNVAQVPKEEGGEGANLDGGLPYGFDHNYVIDRHGESPYVESSLNLAAILSHPPTGRTLRVFTTAPGMQLYTSNYLDGTGPPPAMCKEGSNYRQWQAICLETQTYPDSIYPAGNKDESTIDEEFALGRCFILRPGGMAYVHDVDYVFGPMHDLAVS